MATMVTTTQTQQNELHLYAILSTAQDKLHRNFSRILSRLNGHDKYLQKFDVVFKQMNQRLKAVENAFNTDIKINSQNYSKCIQNNSNNIQKIFKIFESQKNKNLEKAKQFQLLLKNHQNLKLFIDEQYEVNKNKNQAIKQKFKHVQNEIQSILFSLQKKQSISQVTKVKQAVNQLSQQLKKADNQQKFVQFKLDKIELNNQKTQKNQINKEMSMMKDLQQKIKAQLKNSMAIPTRTLLTSSLNVDNIENMTSNNENLTQKSSSFKPTNSVKQLCSIQRPIILNGIDNTQKTIQKLQSYSALHSPHPLQKMINHINDAIVAHDRKFEHIEKALRQTNQMSQSSQKQKKINAIELEQKINAVKPQFIKIWAKCDALEDKNAFLERRLQEKNKQINSILQTIKQTQASKFQQKIKLFQTQIYTNLKQIRSKLQTKLNSGDFQKFSKTTVQKLQLLNDHILLKCDKLQVKKALLFLQSKIKQIILVISQDQQNQKDALLTKKQLKCISCDKQIQKFLGTSSGLKGNWDAFPMKDNSPDNLGRFGMTSFGTLARKLKKLDNKQMPIITNKRNKQSTHSQSKADFI